MIICITKKKPSLSSQLAAQNRQRSHCKIELGINFLMRSGSKYLPTFTSIQAVVIKKISFFCVSFLSEVPPVILFCTRDHFLFLFKQMPSLEIKEKTTRHRAFVCIAPLSTTKRIIQRSINYKINEKVQKEKTDLSQ